MADWRSSTYLDFGDAVQSLSGKTSIWVVSSKKRGDRLGVVSWYGPWMQYVFEPDEGCVFNHGCLTDIALFCYEATEAHRFPDRARSPFSEVGGRS